ncbi:dipeptide ABC transporter ATP-binding protein [Plastoroseomonas arctica]|uniref:ABC transporter ATP-binding protein n=1 Tax=Plastoroseomonas arctica TaxID=1509237 RepID=A0AAF1KI11_9PROT|nr:ABC transporter ATP-binding protein [Plastoroseomonas arctica]MBR0654569.1 ABC transporter ATP-binding protein [Plastoroseomonas arctica]
MAEAPLLELRDLSLRYATARGMVQALDGVSLELHRGQAMGLVGESGSGKSSLVLAILGLLGKGATVSTSRAAFDGEDLHKTAAALRGRRIGMVFQDPSAALNPGLTIGYQIAEPLIHHRGSSERDAMARAVSLLNEVGVARAESVARSYPHQLSGGMKQRAVIATALACEPELLLLDEPTTALDVTVEAQILDLLDDLRRHRNVAMLLVSHNLGIVDRLCDGLTVLYAGRVVEQGETAAILARPQHPYTRGLLAALPRADHGRIARLTPIPGGLPDLTRPEPGCNFRARCDFALPACAEAQLLDGPAAHRVRCHLADVVAAAPPLEDAAPAQARILPAGTRPLIQAMELTKSFRLGAALSLGFRGGLPRLTRNAGVLAVDDVALHVARGEVLGLVGESGCGKSTLGRLMLRLLAADAGRISLDGEIVPAQPDTAFRRRAQIVFQNPDSSLNPRQTVHQALRWPLVRFGIARGAEADREVDRLLELVRLPSSYRSRYPHQMSGGEKQRIGIARALASRPDFLVCDEAVSALDVSVQAAVLNLLADLRDRLGIAYLFISHDIGVIAHIADRIAVMYRGTIVEQGAAAQMLAPPYHPYTEALLSAVPLVGLKGRSAQRTRLAGDASSVPPAGGCRFAPRCPRRIGAVCDTVAPPLRMGPGGHQIMCHHTMETLAALPPALGQAA